MARRSTKKAIAAPVAGDVPVNAVQKARQEGREAGRRVAAEGRAVAATCPYTGQENAKLRAAWLDGLNEHF